MLIEFRVENHRSMKTEQILSMEAAKRDADDLRPRAVSGSDPSLLTVAAIYGANASGKSNVLSALRFMRDAVVLSHRFWSPDRGVPRDPFAWGQPRSEPSLFEAVFLVDGVRTEFGFVADDECFLEEWLHVYPHGRKQIWYERERDTYKFGDSLKVENRTLQSVTRPNALFLSTAVQNRNEQLQTIYRWFRATRTHHVPTARGAAPIFAGMSEDVSRWLFSDANNRETLFGDLDESEPPERLERFREFLQAADVGIVDVKMQEEQDAALGRPRRRVFFQHKSSFPEAWLPLDQESHGTKQLFRLAPLVLNALEHGGLLVVDELESSFHPLLALRLVDAFNDPVRNRQNAQLIFTTHDTNLLGTTLGKPSLRRDQVWLTEKDSEGATVMYPLTDYKPRKEENLERGYLQGRYGAIPFLADLKGI